MARMKRKRKYRSSAFSKSSWNKRVSCRQNMRKGRIKAKAKASGRRRAKYDPNYAIKNEIWQCLAWVFIALIVFFWFAHL